MERHCPSPTTGREPLASKGGKRARTVRAAPHPRGDSDTSTTKSSALDRLGEGVREVYQSERWESWLRSLSKFYDYSLNNTILIAMQMPTATHVASFRSWKRDFNRYVKKGERGIEILVPILVRDSDEECRRPGTAQPLQRRVHRLPEGPQ